MNAPNTGCEFGRMLRQAFEHYCQRYDSKVEGIETRLVIWREKEMPGMQKQLLEVENMATEARKESREAMRGYRLLIYGMLAGFLGLIVTNIFNQFWTSSKMDSLSTLLEYQIKQEVIRP